MKETRLLIGYVAVIVSKIFPVHQLGHVGPRPACAPLEHLDQPDAFMKTHFVLLPLKKARSSIGADVF